MYLPRRCMAECACAASPATPHCHLPVYWSLAIYSDIPIMYLYRQATLHTTVYTYTVLCSSMSHNPIKLETLCEKLCIHIAHYTQNTAHTMHLWLRNTHTKMYNLFFMQVWNILYGRMEFVYSTPPMQSNVEIIATMQLISSLVYTQGTIHTPSLMQKHGVCDYNIYIKIYRIQCFTYSEYCTPPISPTSSALTPLTHRTSMCNYIITHHTTIVGIHRAHHPCRQTRCKTFTGKSGIPFVHIYLG